MNNENYERYQLELIAQEYRGKGYDVSSKVPFVGENLGFDAIAKHKESGKVVVIELVNKSRGKAHALERIRAIERLSTISPEAIVDFRYIDVESNRLRQWQENVGEGRRINVLDAVSQRVPRPPVNAVGRSMYFMQIWSLHVATIRSFGRDVVGRPDGKGGLEIYNELLRLQILLPPEDLVDGVSFNLFDLHEAVLAVAEGAEVNEQYLDGLIKHFRSIRKQIRRYARFVGRPRNQDR